MRELAVWGILLVLVLIYRRLGRIYRFLRRKQEPTPTGRIRFYIDGREVIGMANLKAGQTIVATLGDIKDVKGNPAQLDGAPVWSYSAPDAVTLTPSEDGLTCAITSVGPVAEGVVEAKGDGKQGEEVLVLIASGPLNIVPNDAVTMSLSFGTPTDA